MWPTRLEPAFEWGLLRLQLYLLLLQSVYEKSKIQGDYIELLWSSKVGLRMGMRSTVWKCCDVPMAEPFIHPPLPCFFTFFLSPFFFFSWARVYDAGGEHPGVLAARLPGTQASTLAVRGGAMTQQDTGPDFDTVALLLFFVLTLAQWLTTATTTLGRTCSHHAGQGWVIDSLPVVAKQQNITEQWSGLSDHHYSHFKGVIINHFNNL